MTARLGMIGKTSGENGAFAVSAAIGVVYERLLYRRLYKASHLDQVLFTIGMTYMAVAVFALVGAEGFEPPTSSL